MLHCCFDRYPGEQAYSDASRELAVFEGLLCHQLIKLRMLTNAYIILYRCIINMQCLPHYLYVSK